MAGSDPKVSIGLTIAAVGFRARAGVVQSRDVIELLARTIECAPGDAGLRSLVLEFERSWRSDPEGAGARLLAWLDPPARIHAWQERADLA